MADPDRHCTVVGSGPSGVHFALTALQHGYTVDMIDTGHTGTVAVEPDADFDALKTRLSDPVRYFLGDDYSGVLLPGGNEEFYGIPPGKAYALETVPGHKVRSRDFAPMFSYALGGLAQLWTGGCYPFNDTDLVAYPFDYDDLEPFYEEVSRRIGINGVKDDLAEFIPMHAGLQQPLALDAHSSLLLEQYKRKRQRMRDSLGCVIGRARQAVLSSATGSRKACDYLGRCIWGCPREAIYTPSLSLEDCRNWTQFNYHRGWDARYFLTDDSGRITGLLAQAVDNNERREFAVNTLVLACGTLNTSRIYLESVYRQTGEVHTLHGLMDNRQILMPFVNLRMIGKRAITHNYQYNQLAMGLASEQSEDYVHCLITTLKSAMLHPVVEQLPVDLATALYLFRHLHAALGVVNINFRDTRRPECCITLDVADAEAPELQIKYQPPGDETERITLAVKRVRKALWQLGCVAPPGTAHVRPMGASVHYAGTLPMSRTVKRATVSAQCRSHDFTNLFIADGATYPFLPAKNITFTLMANAVRVATCMANGFNTVSGD